MLTWNDIMETAERGTPPPPRRVEKSEAQWKELLSPEQFAVTRQAGTERPWSSEMCSRFEPGLYGCSCCGEPLFQGDTKFESGSGWPSFTQPVNPAAVAYRIDRSHGMVRVEALCNVCDAHLGHVFPDGPQPSGLRYCMNALSLRHL